MIPIQTTTRLGALLAISGFLIPAVRGEAPNPQGAKVALSLDFGDALTVDSDGAVAVDINRAVATVATVDPAGTGESPAAAPAEVAPKLKAGDAVTLDAVAAATFLKGSAPTKWEKDKLYVFECWATWCGPCIGQIPHLNELHRKFKDKGLRVYGMNVWEDDKAKVEAFVQKKGDEMSYAVALDGKNGPFSTSWLKAAGVNGIPEAFVVKNGKLLFHRHPANLTDEVISALLAGGEQEKEVVAKFSAAPEISVPVPLPEIPNKEIDQLAANAKELGKAGKQEEIERQLDAFLGKHGDTMSETGKIIVCFETMKVYFTAMQDEAGATKYAEKLAAKYPDGMPLMCSGVDRLKAMMVEDMKGGKARK